MQNLPLDPQRIRALFPAFDRPELAGQVFMDNAAGSYTAQTVLDRLDHFYRAHKVQPYGVYAASKDAGSMMDESYALFADALGVDNDWIQFGPSTSQNTYVLAQAFGQYLAPGDVIIVTNQDHEANSGAWRRLEQRGIQVREWAVDSESGHLELSKLENLIDDSVKLIAFPHASNIVGEINDVKAVCELAKSCGAVTVVDGVSYAPHGLPDLSELGCDIYLFSTYKTYGTHLGAMAIRPGLNRALPNQGHYFNAEKLRYRMTPAGPDHAQIGAVGGVIEYFQQLASLGEGHEETNLHRRAHSLMRSQEIGLMQPLLDYLAQRNDIRLIGPTDATKRAPTISFAHDKSGLELAEALAQKNIMTAGGHFYAYRLVEGLNIKPDHGVLRLSFVHYTTPQDIANTMTALDDVLGSR